MVKNSRHSIMLATLLSSITFGAFGQHHSFTAVDVLHYKAQVEPDLLTKAIRGKVNIQFSIPEKTGDRIKFDCGSLVIERVYQGKRDIKFERSGSHLILAAEAFGSNSDEVDVTVVYHGKPERGIFFYPSLEQVYTVFSTSEWLVCNDLPADKATIELSLILPTGLQVISVGDLESEKQLPQRKMRYDWSQKSAVSSYTYGFAAGRFNKVSVRHNKTILHYLATEQSETALKKIFVETGAMLDFFEDRSGVPYAWSSYSQLLTEGSFSQEMDGFSIIRNTYGKQVLEHPAEVSLSAHELAHQWWGNQVTCNSWQHFWLNEGLAVFMSSAFREHRFGRDVYMKDIDVYLSAYQKVADKGKDKPLVFPDWSNPSADDRTLVYYKGAYVFHLLRETMGDTEFWKGIKQYTTRNFGKSVDSKSLQTSFEESSGQNLSAFFTKWVY